MNATTHRQAGIDPASWGAVGGGGRAIVEVAGCAYCETFAGEATGSDRTGCRRSTRTARVRIRRREGAPDLCSSLRLSFRSAYVALLLLCGTEADCDAGRTLRPARVALKSAVG
jgi:hypothetical protein